MKVLSWGRCTVKITPITGSGVTGSPVTLPTPIENSTQLTPTQGNVNEAKVEGGEVEAARYDANSYELATEIRLHSGLATPPLGDADGPLVGEYSVEITPENPTAPVVTVNRASGALLLRYTAAEGIVARYVFKALKPETEGTKMVSIAAGSGGSGT